MMGFGKKNKKRNQKEPTATEITEVIKAVDVAIYRLVAYKEVLKDWRECYRHKKKIKQARRSIIRRINKVKVKV